VSASPEPDAPVHLRAPFDVRTARGLRSGQRVLLSGTVYTARDAAHRRLLEALGDGDELPIPLQDQVLYYVGPTPTPPGAVIGSAGPTTASRMDSLTVPLLERGLRGMIGKGRRSDQVRAALAVHGAIYFVAVGGAAALASQRIRRAEVVAYPELGTEAIRRLELENLPVMVGNDTHGGDLFELGRARYLRSRDP